jgi:hypothetical protein
MAIRRAIASLFSGNVAELFVSRAGRLRAHGQTSRRRTGRLPDLFGRVRGS